MLGRAAGPRGLTYWKNQGAELCMHNSSVRSWADLPGDNFVVIGGYESGMAALYNLTMCGKKCTVASSTAFWKVATDDPSTELAPYTMERVRTAFRFAKASPTLTPPFPPNAPSPVVSPPPSRVVVAPPSPATSLRPRATIARDVTHRSSASSARRSSFDRRAR